MEPQTAPQATQPETQPPQQPNQPSNSQKTNALAIWGFVGAFMLPLIGLILCIVAKGQIKKTGEGGSGLATAGIIISIVIILAQLGLLMMIVFGSIISLQESKRSSNSSSSSSTNTPTSSSTNTSSYSADEKKAVETTDKFLAALKNEDYKTMYSLMGAELKKEYSGVADLQSQVEKTGVNLDSWKIEEVKTNGSGDRITVKGTVALNNVNTKKGTFEFGYYKDTDGSVDMYLWEVRPTY